MDSLSQLSGSGIQGLLLCKVVHLGLAELYEHIGVPVHVSEELN